MRCSTRSEWEWSPPGRRGRSGRPAGPRASARSGPGPTPCSRSHRSAARTDTRCRLRPAQTRPGTRPCAGPASPPPDAPRAAGAARPGRDRANSGSSSRKRTPRCARVTSPGRGCAPPPTRPCGRDRVVRCAERALGGQPGPAEPGDALDLGDLERLVECRRREDAGQPPGQHGLADAGRPDHQEVVTAGRRDLEGALGVVLAADIREVRDTVGRRRRGAGRRGGGLQRSWSRSASRARLGTATTSSSSTSAASERAPRARSGASVPGPPRSARRRQRSAGRPQLPAQRELAADGAAVQSLAAAPGRLPRAAPTAIARSKLGPALRRWAGARFAVRRFMREVEPRVQERGAHALTRLPDRAVGEAHDREGGQAHAERRPPLSPHGCRRHRWRRWRRWRARRRTLGVPGRRVGSLA